MERLVHMERLVQPVAQKVEIKSWGLDFVLNVIEGTSSSTHMILYNLLVRVSEQRTRRVVVLFHTHCGCSWEGKRSGRRGNYSLLPTQAGMSGWERLARGFTWQRANIGLGYALMLSGARRDTLSDIKVDLITESLAIQTLIRCVPGSVSWGHSSLAS